jgi:hypothetical protein
LFPRVRCRIYLTIFSVRMPRNLTYLLDVSACCMRFRIQVGNFDPVYQPFNLSVFLCVYILVSYIVHLNFCLGQLCIVVLDMKANELLKVRCFLVLPWSFNCSHSASLWLWFLNQR